MRLEQLRIRRPYGVIAEDGSGWVPLSSKDADISPAPTRGARNDGRMIMDDPFRQLRIRRPYGVIAEDGSGWVPLSSKDADISPAPTRGARNDGRMIMDDPFIRNYIEDLLNKFMLSRLYLYMN
ncbi:hypothetical protein ACFE04_013206 [Oxalis oulophora]